MTWISAVRVLDPHPWNTLVEIEADDGTVGIGLTQSAPAHIRPIIEERSWRAPDAPHRS